MTSFTANRLYPYSDPTDPADIPGAIQAFAEAVDLDMQLLDDSITRRPFAFVHSASTTKQLFIADADIEATYDFVDADTAGITDLAAHPSRLTPTTQGFWMVWGSMVIPNGIARTKDIYLRRNASDITRYEQHLNDGTSSDPTTMSLAAMAFMNGTTDYFTMTFNPDNAGTDYKISDKRLACFRLTSI